MYNKDTKFSEIPNHELDSIKKRCYDDDTRVLFGVKWVRGSVSYAYIPAELMEEGIPFILHSSINYDGGKEYDKAMKEGAMHMNFEDLHKTFTLNTFSISD